MLKMGAPVWIIILLYVLIFIGVSSTIIALTEYGGLAAFSPLLPFVAIRDLGIGYLSNLLLASAGITSIFTFVASYYMQGLFVNVSGSTAHGDAHFASISEIKKAGLLDNYGIVIGKLKGQIIRTKRDDYSNILLAAPPRAGKGVGVIIPTLLTYPGSVIVYDVKGENYDATARHRLASGDEVYVFSPWDMTTENGLDLVRRSHGFNPLAIIGGIADLEDRNSELKSLAMSFLSARTPQEESFLGNGIDIFVAVCAVALTLADQKSAERGARVYATFKDVVELLRPKMAANGEAQSVCDVLEELAQINGLDPQTQSILAATGATSQKIVDSYLSVLETCGLSVFRDPAVLRAMSQNDFDFSSLRAKAQSFYVIVPPGKAREAAPIVRMFMQWATKSLLKNLPNKETEPYPVLFMIDEFHSLGRMDAIIDATTVMPGYGGRVCLVVQSVESITDIYGESRKDIILDTCQLQIYMSPNNPKTLKYVSEAIGSMTVQQRSYTGKSFAGISDKTQTYSERAQALMTPQQLQQMDKRKLIALVQNNPAIQADKLRFFADSPFKGLHGAQSDKPWPDVPVVKAGDVTQAKDYLKFGDSDGGGIDIADSLGEPAVEASVRDQSFEAFDSDKLKAALAVLDEGHEKRLVEEINALFHADGGGDDS